jgi:hypothetical protein
MLYTNPLDARQNRGELSSFHHIDYQYYHPEWVMIRDCIAGERRIKERGQEYLPSLDTEFGTSYETYKNRAVFVNMVARTVMGLVGTIFRRPLKAKNADKSLLNNVTINGLDLNSFAKKLAYEVCSVGRVGVLVDYSDKKPYLTEYVAENILSWKTDMVDGRLALTYVLLREIYDETPVLDGSVIPSTLGSYIAGGLKARYRVLYVEDGVYKQRLISEVESSVLGQVTYTQSPEIVPTKSGATFSYIPMVIIGPYSATPDVQKSPVYDIATLNIAHYMTSAQLEHGRFYTALPIYYVPTNPGQESDGYVLGPSVVWEVPSDSKPGILEYFGTGLTSLTNSLTEKEEHIAQLGGRIMGIRPQASGESDNIFKMKQANEMSILLNVTESLGAGLTQAFKWYLEWDRKPFADVTVKLNQDFKALQIGARELRAVALLYQQGMLPIENVYETLQSSEFIPEDTTFEEFKDMLSNMDNFPNQPDVEARSEGYPDSKARFEEGQSKLEHGRTVELAEADRKHKENMAKRQEESKEGLQEEMFRQGRVTAQFEDKQKKDKKTPEST